MAVFLQDDRFNEVPVLEQKTNRKFINSQFAF